MKWLGLVALVLVAGAGWFVFVAAEGAPAGSAQIADGKALYVETCAACHGARRGTRHFPQFITPYFRRGLLAASPAMSAAMLLPARARAATDRNSLTAGTRTLEVNGRAATGMMTELQVWTRRSRRRCFSLSAWADHATSIQVVIPEAA